MAYSKINWSDGKSPYRNAENLNKQEQGIYDAHVTADANTIKTADNRTDIDLNTNNILALSTGEVYKGTFTPTGGSEYPLTPTSGDSYYITGLGDSGYTFTGGDLIGRVANNNDKMIYNGTAWSMIDNTNCKDNFFLVNSSLDMQGISSPVDDAVCIINWLNFKNDGLGSRYVYDSTRVLKNDGITVIHGWVRSEGIKFVDLANTNYFPQEAFGVIRNNGDKLDNYSYFVPITTNNHIPVGFANRAFAGDDIVLKSIETLTDRVRVHHDFGAEASIVGYASASVDETFAAGGIRVGCSVGAKLTEIYFFRDLFYTFTTNTAGGITLGSANKGIRSVTWNTAGYFSVDHEDCYEPSIVAKVHNYPIDNSYDFMERSIDRNTTRLYLYKKATTTTEQSVITDITGLNLVVSAIHQSSSQINPQNMPYVTGSNIWFTAKSTIRVKT